MIFLVAAGLVGPTNGNILHPGHSSRHCSELAGLDGAERASRGACSRGGAEDEHADPDAVTSGGASATPCEPAAQMLREAFELLEDQDLPAALRALQAAVLAAAPETLVRLESQCQAERGVALDELLAATRLQVTEPADSRRAFKLLYATPYERPALGRLLAAELTGRLERRYSDRSVREWAARPDEYRAAQADSRWLVADATRAAALCGARLKFDPSLKTDRATRARLADLRDGLARLAARVQSLPGYWAAFRASQRPGPGDEAVQQAIAAWTASTQPAGPEADAAEIPAAEEDERP